MGKDADLQSIAQTLLLIESRLEDIISILKLSKQAQIDSVKQRFLASQVRAGAYKLCDGTHSVTDIAEALEKKTPNVSRALSELEAAGLIRQARQGKKICYVQVF